MMRFYDIISQCKLLRRHDIDETFGKDRRIKHACKKFVWWEQPVKN
jgi:hypothetical protein